MVSRPILGHCSPSDPSSMFDLPAANAVSVAVMANRAHAVVDMFFCARIGAGVGASVILTVVSGDLDWCCRG
eukprot:3358512-Pleurochrysis_carterae.AAC.1